MSRVRENAEAVVADEYQQLRAAYTDPIVPGGSMGSNLPLDAVDSDTKKSLREAEFVAVHGVALGALASSRTSEREIRDYE